MPVKRPRSKRPCPQRRTFSFISSYASKRFHPLSAYESEPYIDEKILKKRMLLSCRVKNKKPSTQLPVETRKCNHCGVAKTPQWREGPMGPKTLCNACGVRYRSGRLLPEYRPAASPTFVSSLHSNSHRRVLEMRKTDMQVTPSAVIDASMPTAPEY